GSCVWLAYLALSNVRQRRGEIGLLRAVGFRSSQLFVLILSRALVIGLIGAALGCVAAVLLNPLFTDMGSQIWATLVAQGPLLGGILLAAPVVPTLASWPPALIAIRQDPAMILQQEA